MVWSPSRLWSFGARLLLAAAASALLASSFGGCQPKRQPHRQIFEEAEEAYRAGHYDQALERYEAFLKAAPDHQLAPLAQQRVLSIERELEVVMGRRQGPRPIYLRPVRRDETPTPPPQQVAP